ncbi:hypothetical protein [Croceicoccus sp. BE223]|uniref:hypothetical protein n=1 Tax=Croceicoccus sp. BE223 TaxID=2817716 RepID=UPI00285A36E0|nr:hypothetical protein [Croceicoccus sp. BE223]MDR7103610.1 quinol monooxygenase YgiN [Croceicoccus sp. BE223]
MSRLFSGAPAMAALVPALALSACATAPVSTPPSGNETAVSTPVPTGVTLGADGFWSVGDVPPTPFPGTVPADLSEGEEDIIGKFARENGLTREQAESRINGPPKLRAELARVAEALRAEPNFVEYRMVRDPAVRIEVWFTDDAAATLARHSRSPYLVAREGGWNQAEQKRRQDLWQSRMEAGRIGSLSVNGIDRKIELGVGTTEEQFLATARARGWDLADVESRYAKAQPAAFADPSIAGHVRALAREATDPQVRMTALGVGRVVMEDGCFHLKAVKDEPGKLVMFGYGATLDRDDQGYLVVRGPGDAVYRIGETGAWNAPNFVDESSDDVKTLRAACGTDAVVNVGYPTSYRLFGLPFPEWVTNYAAARKLSRQAAWDEIVACVAREEKQGRLGLDARDRCVRQFN